MSALPLSKAAHRSRIELMNDKDWRRGIISAEHMYSRKSSGELSGTENRIGLDRGAALATVGYSGLTNQIGSAYAGRGKPVKERLERQTTTLHSQGYFESPGKSQTTPVSTLRGYWINGKKG